MTKQDMTEIMAMLQTATEVYGQKPLSDAAARAWGGLMKPWPIERIREAMQRHMAESSFMPRPADLIRQLEGSAEDRAAAAWAEVRRAVDRHGYWDSVRFSQPAIHFAIERMGGWRALSGGLTEANERWKQAEFARHYARGERVASWGREPGKVQVPAYLRGEHMVENARRGFADYVLKMKVYDPDGGYVEVERIASLPGGPVSDGVAVEALPG